MPQLSSLRDNFNDNSLGAIWTETQTGTTTVTEQNFRQEIALPAVAGASDYGDIFSGNYDFTGSYLYIETIEHPSTSTNANSAMYVHTDSNNWFRWVKEASTLYAQRNNAGVQATLFSVAFSSTDHKWWRIREDRGVVYYDTSPDRYTWTNHTTYTHGMTITAMKALIAGFCYQAETNPGNFKFDNVNWPSDSKPGNYGQHISVGSGMSRSEVAF